jgi:hypothetical protein
MNFAFEPLPADLLSHLLCVGKISTQNLWKNPRWRLNSKFRLQQPSSVIVKKNEKNSFFDLSLRTAP